MKRIIASLAIVLGLLPLQAQRVLTLKECIQLAEQNNIKARDARSAIKSADEQKKYAQSQYLPQVNITGFGFASNKHLIAKDNFSEFMQNLINALEENVDGFEFGYLKNIAGAGITAVEPIYTGGKITSYNKLADLQKETSNLKLEITLDEIDEQVEKYYYSLLRLYSKRKTLAIADSELVRYGQDAKNAFELGVANKSDLLAVELEQNKTRSLRNKLENGISLLKRAMAQFIGLDGQDIDVDTTLLMKIEPPQLLLADHHAALDNRHESTLLDKNIEAQELYRRIAKADLLPTFAVGGNAGYSHVDNTNNTRLTAFATLSIPISAFWSNNHQLKTKDIAVQQAKDMRDDKRQMMVLQMQEAYDQLSNAYDEILLEQKSIEKANENLRMNEDYYTMGTANMTTLLDAQRLQQQALDQYNDAVCEYQLCRSHYLTVTARK
ncbi:MAG: TolC family protein [Prevotella sp.]|nr:TolC family protein [Prevotella sp.]